MIALISAALITAALADSSPPSAEECQVLRAAIAAELASERHFAETLELTAIPSEWLLEGSPYASGASGQPVEMDPPPAMGIAPVSLSACRVQAVFSGAWKVRRNGTRNLALASKEHPLVSKADTLRLGLWSTLITRASIDGDKGKATVIFGGPCTDVDALSVTKDASGEWLSSKPQSLWSSRCETPVTKLRRP